MMGMIMTIMMTMVERRCDGFPSPSQKEDPQNENSLAMKGPWKESKLGPWAKNGGKRWVPFPTLGILHY